MTVLSIILLIVLLIGFIAALAAYKPVRNRIILTTGYDADKGLGNFLAIASIVIPLILCFNICEDPIILTAIFLVLFLINVANRIPKIGIGNAFLLTLLQSLGVFWIIIKKIWSVCWRIMEGVNANADKEARRRDAALAQKEKLYRQYKASVAQAEANRDESLIMTGGDVATDAAIAEAEDEYNRKVFEIDHY